MIEVCGRSRRGADTPNGDRHDEHDAWTSVVVALDAAGKPVDIRHGAIEVLRRQSDGTWKLIVGGPNGRG